MFLDDDLPKPKESQLFPRKLEGMSVAQMKEYRLELEAEIANIDREITARDGVRAEAEMLFKKST